jgi:hypothetical protein
VYNLDARAAEVIHYAPMYIRWQSRKRSGRPQFGRRYREVGKRRLEVVDVHWRAILVENVRIDGKPTQRHIAYLAGFTESALAIPAQQRFIWDGIKQKLDHLGNRISPEGRRKIEAVMVAKIGKPPTKRERDRLDRRRRQLMEAATTSSASPSR